MGNGASSATSELVQISLVDASGWEHPALDEREPPSPDASTDPGEDEVLEEDEGPEEDDEDGETDASAELPPQAFVRTEQTSAPNDSERISDRDLSVEDRRAFVHTTTIGPAQAESPALKGAELRRGDHWQPIAARMRTPTSDDFDTPRPELQTEQEDSERALEVEVTEAVDAEESDLTDVEQQRGLEVEAPDNIDAEVLDALDVKALETFAAKDPSPDPAPPSEEVGADARELNPQDANDGQANARVARAVDAAASDALNAQAPQPRVAPTEAREEVEASEAIVRDANESRLNIDISEPVDALESSAKNDLETQALQPKLDPSEQREAADPSEVEARDAQTFQPGPAPSDRYDATADAAFAPGIQIPDVAVEESLSDEVTERPSLTPEARPSLLSWASPSNPSDAKRAAEAQSSDSAIASKASERERPTSALGDAGARAAQDGLESSDAPRAPSVARSQQQPQATSGSSAPVRQGAGQRGLLSSDAAMEMSQSIVGTDALPFDLIAALSAQDSPLGRYLVQVDDALRANWVLPLEVRAEGIRGETQVTFAIDKRGRVSEREVTSGSGRPDLDRYALAAVPDELPPPPTDLPDPLYLTWSFKKVDNWAGIP